MINLAQAQVDTFSNPHPSPGEALSALRMVQGEMPPNFTINDIFARGVTIAETEYKAKMNHIIGEVAAFMANFGSEVPLDNGGSIQSNIDYDEHADRESESAIVFLPNASLRIKQVGECRGVDDKGRLIDVTEVKLDGLWAYEQYRARYENQRFLTTTQHQIHHIPYALTVNGIQKGTKIVADSSSGTYEAALALVTKAKLIAASV